MRKLFLLAAFLLAPVALFAQTQEAKWAANTVAIQAEGEFEADPDLATLTFQVFAQDKLLQKAYEQASAATQRILQLAARANVSPQDISGGRLRVVPMMEWSDRRSKIRSYRVETTLRFRIRDFARIGALVDEAVESGIAELRSVDYSLEDEETPRQRAISAAMRSAENRARAALGENGRRLGALHYASVDLKESRPPMQPWLEHLSLSFSRSDRTAAVPEAPQLAGMTSPAPEKIRVQAVVQCVFQLE